MKSEVCKACGLKFYSPLAGGDGYCIQCLPRTAAEQSEVMRYLRWTDDGHYPSIADYESLLALCNVGKGFVLHALKNHPAAIGDNALQSLIDEATEDLERIAAEAAKHRNVKLFG